jgi:leader peptidase (prepilin peptidase)/N-methyltransferase
VTLISPTADFWFFACFALLFGLIFGSFLNVCIYRLPLGRSVIAPGSACPGCNTAIAAYDNIPVVSWWVLGGKCRHCRIAISPRYWIVELLTGLLFFAAFVRFGPGLAAVKICVFSFLVLGLIFTDADTHLLPDALTLPGIWIGLAFAPFVAVSGIMGLLYAWTALPPLDWHIGSFLNAIAGMVLGAGFIYLVGEAWYYLRGVEAMGFGDVKLMAMVGAFLGPKLVLLTLFFGSFSGTVAGISLAYLAYRKRMQRWKNASPDLARARAQHATQAMMRRFPIPFGVFLGIGALISAFFGEALLAAYLGAFR